MFTEWLTDLALLFYLASFQVRTLSTNPRLQIELVLEGSRGNKDWIGLGLGEVDF